MTDRFCLVTALFNVKRETMPGNDGRTWDDYLEWFKKTLQIKSPMIVFCEEDTADFVRENRKYPTEIITHSVSELPYYYLRDEIDSVIKTSEFQSKIKDGHRTECQHPMYTVVQYSKFKWLDRCVDLNPFNSDFFFWIDAGASRHFEDFDVDCDFPSKDALEKLDEMGDKFLIQWNVDAYQSLANADTLTDEYLWDCRAVTCGSFFGGGPNAVKQVNKEVEDVWVNKMVRNGLVNNEQIVLAYLLKNKPDLFAEYRRYNYKHMDIFTEFY